MSDSKQVLDFGIYLDGRFLKIESRSLRSITHNARTMPQIRRGHRVEVRNLAGHTLWESRPADDANHRAQSSASVSTQILWEMVESGRSVVEAMRTVCGAELVDRMLDELYEELRKRGER